MIAPHIAGFYIADETESDQIGLKSVEHGLVLVADTEGNRWTLATEDLDYFHLVLAATLASPREAVVTDPAKFPIMLRAWHDVGRLPDPPEDPNDLERD